MLKKNLYTHLRVVHKKLAEEVLEIREEIARETGAAKDSHYTVKELAPRTVLEDDIRIQRAEVVESTRSVAATIALRRDLNEFVKKHARRFLNSIKKLRFLRLSKDFCELRSI
ncbi:hypothetical protein COOONC_09795 [Cooperia oncophora]